MRARLLLAAAALLFSTGGTVIKGVPLNAWQTGGARSLIACVVISLVLPPSRRWRARYIPIAIAYACTLGFFVASTKLTTSANAIFLQSTAPLFVLILGPLLLHEAVHRSDVFFMVAVATGMTLFFTAHEVAVQTAPDPVTGNWFGAASAISWAFTLVGLRAVTRHAADDEEPGMAVIAMGNCIAGIVLLAFAFPFPALGIAGVAALLWLGIFQISLSYVCLTRGIKHVPALEATTVLLLEPALNPVWTWLVQHERPATQSLVGGAVIILATLVKTWYQSRH